MEFKFSTQPDGTQHLSITLSSAEGSLRISGTVQDVEKALSWAVRNAGLTGIRRHQVWVDHLPTAR